MGVNMDTCPDTDIDTGTGNGTGTDNFNRQLTKRKSTERVK